MSTGKRAGLGFISLLTRNVLGKVMGIFSLIVLANVLSKNDFGVVAITDILLNLISVLGTVGLSDFLVAYKKDNDEAVFQSAFWLNVCATLFILILVLVIAPFWATKYNDQRIVYLSWISGGVFLFSQLQILPRAILSRTLNFELLTKLQNPFVIIIPIAKIIAAFAGWGIYALVLPTLICIPVQTILMYRAAKWRFKFDFYMVHWPEIFQFIKPLLIGVMIARIADQADGLILGSAIGLPMLGVYKNAFDLSGVIIGNVTTVSGSVFSATLPRYNTAEKMGDIYIKVLRVMSFFLLPILIAMGFAAPSIFSFLYKGKFDLGVFPFQLLIIVAILRTFTSNFGSVYNSMGQPGYTLKLTILQAPLQILFALLGGLIGAKWSEAWGLYGLTIASLLVRLFFYGLTIDMFMKFIGRKWSEFFSSSFALLLPATLSSLLASIIFFVKLPIEDLRLRSGVQLFSFGLVFLVVLWWLLRKQNEKEVKMVALFLSQTQLKMYNIFSKVFKVTA